MKLFARMNSRNKYHIFFISIAAMGLSCNGMQHDLEKESLLQDQMLLSSLQHHDQKGFGETYNYDFTKLEAIDNDGFVWIPSQKDTTKKQNCNGVVLPCLKKLGSGKYSRDKSPSLKNMTKYKLNFLLFALHRGDNTTFKSLIEDPRIDPNIGDEDGITPLMWAAARGKAYHVEILLKHPKIDRKIVDHKGKNALWHANRAGHRDISKMLRSAPIYNDSLGEELYKLLDQAPEDRFRDIQHDHDDKNAIINDIIDELTGKRNPVNKSDNGFGRPSDSTDAGDIREDCGTTLLECLSFVTPLGRTKMQLDVQTTEDVIDLSLDDGVPMESKDKDSNRNTSEDIKDMLAALYYDTNDSYLSADFTPMFVDFEESPEEGPLEFDERK